MERKSLNVFIVDDDGSWRSNLSEMLEDTGHSVTVADNLHEAINLLSKDRFDLAIVDIRLDENDKDNTDGVKVLEKLASLGGNTKAVITTGHREQIGTYRDIFARWGVFDYFGKSDERGLQKLLSVVERIVTSRESGLWAIEGQPISFETLQTLQRMVSQFVKCLGADLGQLLLDRGDDRLVVRVSTRREEEGVFNVGASDSISGQAFKPGAPVNVPDVTDPKWASHYQKRIEGMHSELAVPLRYGEKIIGVLNVESARVKAFGESNEAMMTVFAEQSVMAIRNDRLLQGIKALQEMSGEMLRPPVNLERIWALILDRGLELVGGRHGNVSLVEGEDVVVSMTRTGEAKARRPNEPQRFPIHDSITGWAVSKREPIVVRDVLAEEPYKTLYKPGVGPNMRSELVVPIVVQDHVIGALNVESSQVGAFGEDEKALLVALADQAAATVLNVKQYDQAKMREKMAGIGELSGDLVHRMNSPLSAIRANVQLIQLNCEDEVKENAYLADKLVEIHSITDRAIDMVQQMKDKAHSIVLEQVDIVPTLKTALAGIAIPNTVRLTNTLDKLNSLPKVKATQQLVMVFRNMINNAIAAMPDGGELSLSAAVVGEKWVEVYVIDTGVGVPEDWREEIFNLLSVFGKDRQGQGLGLWYSRAYIEACGGELPRPDSTVGVGTKFTVRLPVWS
jgi:signal transduction histidine kinase/CheY-like chemotaxis protein